ncbi:HECT-domain protein [Ostertagia ostertagi]
MAAAYDISFFLKIVQLLLRECLHGEWPSESSVPLGHTRMISRGAILSLLAELVKSYPGVASLICEAKEDGQSVIHQLIEHFIDGSQEKDTLGSLKTLISILAACNHSPKAQESLVSDMKASLLAVGNSSLSSSAICSKITELCSLLVMMLDSCPSSMTSLSHSHHRHLLGGAPSSITKLFHKKRICNDLVKTITYLQLSQKEAIDTVNTVLKTLETLMRTTNSSNSSANAASITHGARNVARAQAIGIHQWYCFQAVINAAVADAVRIPSPSNSRDAALSHAIDLGLLANNLLNDARELSNEQDDRSDPMLVRVSDNVYLSDNDQPQENDHHRGEVMDEEMDEEAVEDSMSSGEEDNEDRTVEDEEGDDREEDDTMDGEDQDDEEEEDDEDGRREGDVQATVRVDAEESGEDGEEEEEDDDEEMYDYPEEDEDALHDMTFDLLDRPGLSSFGFDDFIFGPPIGINREHRGARREQSSAGVHPLMVRPAHIADSQPSHNQQSAPTVSRLERIARLGNYRSLLLDSGSAGIPVTLTRQNAIRRIGAADRARVGPTSQFFDRLFDLHARDRGGPLMNMTAGRIVSMGSNLLDSPEERRMRQPASAPSALDRYTDGADMMDGVSMQYVAIIINSIVTRVARKRVEEEKAKEAAEQAAKKLLEESSKGTSESAPKASDETGTSGATATVLAHPPTEVARQAWDESALGNRETDVATALSAGDSVTNGDASGLPVVEGEAMDTSATVASSLPEAEVDEERMITPPLPVVSNVPHEGDDVRDASDRSDNSGHTETTTDEPLANGSTARTAAENNAIPDEIREILGVDAPYSFLLAFLVANAVRFWRNTNVQFVKLRRRSEERTHQLLLQLRNQKWMVQAVIASLPAHERTQVLAEMDESELQRLPTEMQDEARRARANLEPLVSVCPSWLDSITVSGVGHNERALKIAKNVSRVAIHPLLSAGLSKNVLDSLGTIAKTYPGHFLPSSLRKTSQQAQAKDGTSESQSAPVRDASPPLDLFWELCRHHLASLSLLKKHVKVANVCLWKVPTWVASCDISAKIWLLKNGQVQDRLLRVISTIVQTLPNDTMALLGNLEGPNPLESQLKAVIDVLMRGSCSNEGLADGRTLLVECMRALPPSITDTIYEQLFTAVQNVGLELQPQVFSELSVSFLKVLSSSLFEIPFQIERLIEELGEPDTTTSTDDLPSTSKAASATVESDSTATGVGTDRDRRLARTRIGRLVLDAENGGRFTLSASSCPELQLPAVTMLTDKSGAQYKLLSALQTLSKIRDTMRQMKEERRKKEELEKKKKEEEAKAAEAKQSAENKTIDPVAVDDATAPTPETSQSAAVQEESTPMATSTSAVDEDQSKQSAEETNEDVVLSHRLTGLEGMFQNEMFSGLSPHKSSSAFALRALGSRVSMPYFVLEKASDHHAVLALQPAAEAFFLVHAVPRPAHAASDHHHDDPDTLKMIAFAEKHREVLNQVLRQNNTALSPGGPFAALIQFPKLLDFDVNRTSVELMCKFKSAIANILGLLPRIVKKVKMREVCFVNGSLVITREIFNPNYALFITAPGDMVTYMINKASYINPEHLDYFKFVGRLIAKAIYDNKLLDCYFTRAFYKHILNLPVRYQDIESEVEEFGVRSIRDLKPDGRKIDVTDANKEEYVKLVCQMKMTGSIRKQLDAFLTGFYEVIPKQLISMFNEQELELLISGLPDVDIDDLANNTEYKMYTKTSAQIQWFWRALRSFEPEDRAKFLQFVTGTSKVPLQGFASLEGMNGIQKFSIHMDCRGGDRLPAAHTCFNQLDLPQYESYEKLRDSLLIAIRECTEGFGFA